MTAGPARPVVAAFDFDGTLTRGGSVWPFLVFLRGRRRVLTAALALLGPLAVAAVLAGRHADAAKEALFRRTLAGVRADELAGPAAAFGRAHLHRRARPETLRRVAWHQRQGHRLVLVSASPACYLEAVAQELGMDGVVATRLAVADDGRLTGAYDGRNCRGEEKLRRLREWIEGAVGAEGVVVWAYGNSRGDRRLLAGADVGVDAGRLGPLGALRAYRRLGDLPEEEAG